MWRMATLVHVESTQLKHNWIRKLERVPMYRGFQAKLNKKIIISFRHISVTYGSFGRMTLATMKRYVYALLTETCGLCVLFNGSKFFESK